MIVVTQNVCGLPWVGNPSERVRMICAEYAKRELDVVALQEVHGQGSLEQFREQLWWLPYMHYEPHRLGPAAGLVIFSRTPIVAAQYLPFSTRVRDFQRGYHKGALLCRVDGVWILNFHISSNPRQREQTRLWAAQARQVEMLRKFIAERAGEGRLVKLGDANIHHGTELYRRLAGGLHNPFDATPTLLGPRGSSFCLDYILVRGWNAEDITTFRIFEGRTGFPPRAWKGQVSDHSGLGAELPL